MVEVALTTLKFHLSRQCLHGAPLSSVKDFMASVRVREKVQATTNLDFETGWQWFTTTHPTFFSSITAKKGTR